MRNRRRLVLFLGLIGGVAVPVTALLVGRGPVLEIKVSAATPPQMPDAEESVLPAKTVLPVAGDVLLDGHTATLLGDGSVLIAGGFVSYGPPPFQMGAATNAAETYDSVTKTFKATKPMHVARGAHAATLLQ